MAPMSGDTNRVKSEDTENTFQTGNPTFQDGESPGSEIEVEGAAGAESPQPLMAGDEYSGISKQVTNLHLAMTCAVMDAGVPVVTQVQKVVFSYLTLILQVASIAALYLAVTLPSCHANRQCPNSMYC